MAFPLAPGEATRGRTVGQNFFELVKAALPEGVTPDELMRLAPSKWWEAKPYLASAYALRKCVHINWGAYLERYPDVKACGMDACLHFLRHGVHEGRKLAGWNGLKRGCAGDAPIVSVVIINFNNAHLLSKCLGSVIGQTLKNIEIIVVDDCSTDNSRELIQAYASKDERIKLIVNPKNSATLVARKRGVEAATGRYLMLLDSDDYMAPEACEVAAREIAKGYDLVKFGAYVVNSLNAPKAEIRDSDNFCNRGASGEYFNDEITTTIFRDGKLSWHVWSFIYLRELCQNAFAELPDEYITGPDDLYALLAITRRAGSLLKINDRLIYYSYGPGVSVTVDKSKVLKYASARAGAIRAIHRYASQYSLNIGLNGLYRNLCADLLEKLLAVAGGADAASCFDNLAGLLGFEFALEALFLRHSDKLEKVAALLQPPESRQAGRSLGVFFPKLHYGGMETLVISVCAVLRANGYQLTVLLEERSDRDSAVAALAKVVYLGPFKQDLAAFSKRLLNLEEAITASSLDALLYFAPHRAALLWDMMVLHHHQVPVIPWIRFNFDWLLSGNKARERALAEDLFRKAAVVVCQSTIAELYLRLRGVNAICMPPPVPQLAPVERDKIPARVAILGRFGDPIKQAGEGLKVLRELTSKAPWVSACLIGDFYTAEQLEQYRQKIREYGLERNITVTGWTDRPDLFLRECSILLSVSVCEAFGMGIAEAQALGLPCVIYDLPIDLARGNASIISVPQGDYKAAAAKIISLLENPEQWRRLSQIAVENSQKYSPDKFADRLKFLLNNFQRLSPLRRYALRDYEALISCASFYSGRLFEDAL